MEGAEELPWCRPGRSRATLGSSHPAGDALLLWGRSDNQSTAGLSLLPFIIFLAHRCLHPGGSFFGQPPPVSIHKSAGGGSGEICRTGNSGFRQCQRALQVSCPFFGEMAGCRHARHMETTVTTPDLRPDCPDLCAAIKPGTERSGSAFNPSAKLPTPR